MILAPLLLALAQVAAPAAEPEVLVVVMGGAVSLRQTVPVIGGHPVMPGSVECHGLAPVTYVPSVERVAEIRAWTERVLRRDVEQGILVSPFGRESALRLLRYFPAVRFYDRPTYNYSRHPDGSHQWMCAQGFSGLDGPKIAADDSRRTERLVCYEWVNWYLGAIGREDEWDSAYVQFIENTVGSQLTGGWRTE